MGGVSWGIGLVRGAKSEGGEVYGQDLISLGGMGQDWKQGTRR